MYTNLSYNEWPRSNGSVWIVGRMAVTMAQLRDMGYRQSLDGSWAIKK